MKAEDPRSSLTASVGPSHPVCQPSRPHLPCGPHCRPWPSEAVLLGVLRVLKKGHLPTCSAGRLGGAHHRPPCNRDMQSARVSSCLRLPPDCHGRQCQRRPVAPLPPLRGRALSEAGHSPLSTATVQESGGTSLSWAAVPFSRRVDSSLWDRPPPCAAPWEAPRSSSAGGPAPHSCTPLQPLVRPGPHTSPLSPLPPRPHRPCGTTPDDVSCSFDRHIIHRSRVYQEELVAWLQLPFSGAPCGQPAHC